MGTYVGNCVVSHSLTSGIPLWQPVARARQVITYAQAHGRATGGMLFLQARGTEGVPLGGIIPGITLPPTARLVLQVCIMATP